MMLLCGLALSATFAIGAALGWYACVACFRDRLRRVERAQDALESDTLTARQRETDRRAAWEAEARARMARIWQARQDIADEAIASGGVSEVHRKWAKTVDDFSQWFDTKDG